MKYTDRSFRLKLYVGAVDQRCQLEPMTTEASSTPRPNATLSSESELPQHTDVPHTRDDNDRISNGQVSQRRRDRRVEAWRQFVMEWEPKLVGLLMHVLSYRFRDDIPSKLAAFARLAHESQSLEAVNDDTKIGVTVLLMEDMGVRAHPIGNSARIASWTQTRETSSRSREHNITLTANLCQCRSVQPKSKGKGKDSKDTKGRSKGKDAKNEWSKKAKVDDLRRCSCCQKTGHVKHQFKTRKKDLADAEGKPVTANSHPNDTAAVVPLHSSLPDEHAMTRHMAMPCVERKTPCEDVNVETMMRPDASGTAPTGTECVKIISAIPTCETFLMWDKCAGGGICPRGSDQTAQKDTTAATMQLVTAPDDPVH